MIDSLKDIQLEEFPDSKFLDVNAIAFWAFMGGHERVRKAMIALTEYPNGGFYNHQGYESFPTGFRYGESPEQYISGIEHW